MEKLWKFSFPPHKDEKEPDWSVVLCCHIWYAQPCINFLICKPTDVLNRSLHGSKFRSSYNASRVRVFRKVLSIIIVLGQMFQGCLTSPLVGLGGTAGNFQVYFFFSQCFCILTGFVDLDLKYCRHQILFSIWKLLDLRDYLVFCGFKVMLTCGMTSTGAGRVTLEAHLKLKRTEMGYFSGWVNFLEEFITKFSQQKHTSKVMEQKGTYLQTRVSISFESHPEQPQDCALWLHCKHIPTQSHKVYFLVLERFHSQKTRGSVSERANRVSSAYSAHRLGLEFLHIKRFFFFTPVKL